MTSFVLKIIAIISMFIDHLGDSIFRGTTAMNVVGRIAFPIFAFQISEGYIHTQNLKKYFLRLFLFAIISQIPFMLFCSMFASGFSLNIFFTLTFGLLSIFIYDKVCHSSLKFSKFTTLDFIFKHFLAILVFIVIAILAEVCKFDYGFFGITIILLFYIFRNNKILLATFFTISCIIKYTISILTYGYHYLYIFLCLFTILPIIFICLYNKKQGKKIKYVLYIFYPAHLLILYIVFELLLKIA